MTAEIRHHITVPLGERSYPIVIGENLLSEIGNTLKKAGIASRYAVIADDTVAKLYGEQLLASLKGAGLDCALLSFPAGEASKNLRTFAELASRLAQNNFDRKSAIIGFGGGVSGDLAGFLAASYMRGIPFIQIPTTLLAQVDSSVGGKTGVDIAEGKNLIGAFYQPKAVYIDISLLQTLPKEELVGGFGEVIKYGIIRDRVFFDFLVQERNSVLSLAPEKISRLIASCCTIKAEIVAADEKESGLRRILNFGHTIGHAIEAASDFTITHGFAVAVGMAAAARLSFYNGLLAEDEKEQIIDAIKSYDLPVETPPAIKKIGRQAICNFLRTDKKNRDGRLFFVLPTAIGKTVITSDVEWDLLEKQESVW